VREVSRRGIDKVVSRGRGDCPFALTIEQANGCSRIDLARAVIDASGTWSNPNPLAASGTRAIGQEAVADRVVYGIPAVLGADRCTYAHQRVLVVGGGHSAANVLLDLAKLAESDDRLRITWAVRGRCLTRIFGGATADKLPARGKLGSDLKQLVDGERLQLVLGFAVEGLSREQDGVVVFGRVAGEPCRLGPVDRIVVCTGQRPDLSMTRELRLDLDPWLESTRTLGPMIDPNLHSCGTVPPHGYKELTHPEPGYFAVGIKSYGRAPTFLMATGYEQVRSVAAHLAGDEAAAGGIRLVLPETGVCTADYQSSDAADADCCGGPAPADVDACCSNDMKARESGAAGCGCGSIETKPLAAASCCVSDRNA
jgi:thioredoxin reductase